MGDRIWQPEDSGREAFDYYFSVLLQSRMFSVEDYNKCKGVQLWRAFLDSNPNATLAECIEEYKRRVKRNPDPHWTYRLLDAFHGRVYPEFIETVLSLAPPKVAHDLATNRRCDFDDHCCSILDAKSCEHRAPEGVQVAKHRHGPFFSRKGQS